MLKCASIMFHPLFLFIGLRYARARSQRFFVSFITWVSLIGVAVGVAALIVVLSVMNGLENELRTRLLALSAPVRIDTVGADVDPDWQALARRLSSQVGNAIVEPYAEVLVLAVRQPEMMPLQLRSAGASTARELRELLIGGSVDAMEAGNGVILGVLAAETLGVTVGDTLNFLIPTVSAGALPEAKLREFRVVGIFEAGIQDHDGALVYADLETLYALGANQSGGTGLAVLGLPALQAPALAAGLRGFLASQSIAGLRVTDWTDEHASYFRAIKIEKTMMALILLLVVAVAAFNIVAMLVMVVTEKRTDIAIVRTLGMSPGKVAAIFVAQGTLIGWLGVTVGVALGVWLATHVSAILSWLERVAGWSLFDANVYYISQVPSEVHRLDVFLVAISALVVTALATIYPALRAAATSPAEALRYE
jgi:lipoprotein-releasing system permease protein